VLKGEARATRLVACWPQVPAASGSIFAFVFECKSRHFRPTDQGCAWPFNSI